jgi:type II restriction enzyme
MISIEKAKDQLDMIIKKARVDLYKPIQIAEVLRRSRIEKDIIVEDLISYKNPSLKWRDTITSKLLGKTSSSSARYQHDIWNDNAMPPNILKVLDEENKKTGGVVEKYIYMRFMQRQGMISEIVALVEDVQPSELDLDAIFKQFIASPGLRRSVDKAYEVVTYSILDTITSTLETTITVQVPSTSIEMVKEFSKLSQVLLGLDADNLQRTFPAKIYRVGVTNAADRGLDMWGNFGVAIQVKHLTLNDKLASEIVDQIEADNIIIVCQNAESSAIETLVKQISWGTRVRGIIQEKELIELYEKCLRGKFADKLAKPLHDCLINSFKAEFPQIGGIVDFIERRGYSDIKTPDMWHIQEEDD